MALKLYNDEKTLISSGTFNNPLRTHHDGKSGSTDTHLVYVRNDDLAFFYEKVALSACDKAGYDDTIGEYGTGFSVKLSYGTVEPLPHEWNQVDSGVSAELPAIVGSGTGADTTTYFPFWVRIHIPGNTPVQNKTDICLKLTYVKRPVTS
tara:strand:- start:34288 stop:34737 length:450 start_codon:yes stop_codon:yes gene_type:complete